MFIATVMYGIILLYMLSLYIIFFQNKSTKYFSSYIIQIYDAMEDDTIPHLSYLSDC